MAVIGIVTCEVLELEFAQLLASDPDVDRVSILENATSARLADLLEASPLRYVQRLPHVHAFGPEPDHEVEALIRVLRLGLHRTRSVLSGAIAAAARELRPHVEALLLGYGLCGNALEDPRAVLDVDIPVFLPMDGCHPVDDCIALCLGGRDRYHGEQCRVPGTFFLTPGWTQHWKRMLDSRTGEIAQPALARTLAGYERALLVTTPVLPETEMRRRGQEFSEKTGLRLEVCQGTLALLAKAWSEAKSCVQAGVGERRPAE
ncbi:hypothetical protein DB347_15165 [Opitutaceae bacterium EW11]|nr:hypothetical protein DB347_15165 [Opitutaceae bacterium EW11]